MSKASVTSASGDRFAKPAGADPDLRGGRSLRIDRPDRDQLQGRIGQGPGRPDSKALSVRLDQRVRSARVHGLADGGSGFGAGDMRQQAVVKLHYFSHAKAGGGLAAHVRYLARDGASQDAELDPAAAREVNRRDQNEDLTRPRREVFFSAERYQFDPSAELAKWAQDDRRHFRIIVAAEQGPHLADLVAYAREVMARAEAALGKPLEWVGVNHSDTDNPHTHILLRGRDGAGRDLILPRDFVKHGLRGIARDVATEQLGQRTREQADKALQREARRHAPTRLDRMLAEQATADGALRLSAIRSPDGNPAMTQALRARAQELQRLGLARQGARGTLVLEPGWQDRLKAIELHLDIAKRQAQARIPERSRTPDVQAPRRARDGGRER